MIEETIATYIANNTSFQLGTDIFLSSLPRDDREGLTVKYMTAINGFASDTYPLVVIILQYKDYTVARDNVSTIVDLLQSKYGKISPDWGILGEVNITNYGIDEYGRYSFGVAVNVIEE